MIDARDLRIGNLVIVNNPKYRPDITGKVCAVSGIDTNRTDNHFKSGTSVSLYVQGDQYKDTTGQWIEFLEPVLITEEHLFKLGFVNTRIGLFEIEVLSYGRINVHISKSRLLVELGTKGGMLFGDTKIKHVHQLQNLHFALTGKELELK